MDCEGNDAHREYGPPKTLYNRWKRSSRVGVFARTLTGLASEAADEKAIMIDGSATGSSALY